MKNTVDDISFMIMTMIVFHETVMNRFMTVSITQFSRSPFNVQQIVAQKSNFKHNC